jgi:hypothetical protein
MGGDMASENQQGAFNADSKMPRSDISKSGVMGEDMAPENQRGHIQKCLGQLTQNLARLGERIRE